MKKRTNNQKNMDRLIQLIQLAKGDRSIRTYAEMSGISASNISRILNGKLAKTPSKEMLERLTSADAKPQNGVTLEDLLLEAGYQDRPLSSIQADPDLMIEPGQQTIIEKRADQNAGHSSYDRLLHYYMFLSQYKDSEPVTLQEKYRTFEVIAPGIIFHYLTDSGVRFQIEVIHKKHNDFFNDLILTTEENHEKLEWKFGFLTSLSSMHSYSLEKNRLLYPILGRLSMMPPDSQKKYCLVTDIEQFSDEVQRFALNNSLKANFSVILIDLKKITIVKETVISKYE